MIKFLMTHELNVCIPVIRLESVRANINLA